MARQIVKSSKRDLLAPQRRSLPLVLQRDRRKSWISSHFLVVGFVLLIALTVGTIVIYSHGPISADGIAARIETFANDRLAGAGSVAFAGGEVEWVSMGEGIALRLAEPEIRLAGTPEPIRAREVELNFSIAGLLQNGLRPRGVTLRGASISVDLASAQSAVANASARGDPSEDAVPTVDESSAIERNVEIAASTQGLRIIRDLRDATTAIANRVKTSVDDIGAIGLERVNFVDGALTITRAGEVPWQFLGMNAFVETGREPHVEAQAILQRDQLRTPFAFEIDVSSDGTPKSGGFRFDDFSIVDQLGENAVPFFISTPVSVSGALEFAEAELSTAAFSVRLGAGQIGDKPRPRRRFDLQEVALDAVFDARSGSIDVAKLAVTSPFINFDLFGSLEPWKGDPSGEQMRLTLQTENFVFSDNDSQGPPISLDAFTMSGLVDVGRKSVVLDRIIADHADFDAAMSLRSGWGEGGHGTLLSGVYSTLNVAALREMWLPPFSPGGRQWFRDNFLEGVMQPGQFEITIRPPESRPAGKPPIETMLRAGFSEAKVRYLRDMPPLELERGFLRIDSEKMLVELGPGNVTLEGGRQVQLQNGTIEMNGLGFPDPGFSLAVTATGGTPAFIQMIKDSPVDDGSPLTFGPEGVSGEVEADLTLTMLATPDLDRRNIEYLATARVSEFASSEVVGDRVLSDGTLELVVTANDLSIKGDVVIDGAQSDVSYSRSLSSGSLTGNALALSTRLDAKGRKALGLNLEGLITGETPVSVEAVEGDLQRSRIEIDLKDAVAAIPAIGWRKEKGQPGMLSFIAPQSGSRRRLEDFRLVGGGLDVAGWIEIVEGEGIVEADLQTFRLSSGDDARAVVRTSKGVLNVDVRGKRIDARPLIKSVLGSKPKGDGPAFALDLAVEQVIGHNATSITGLKLNLRQAGGQLSSFKMSGQINGRLPLSGEATGGEQTEVRVASADGGGLLRFLNLYRWADGGDLSFRAGRPNGGDWSGVVKIADFNVKGDPVVDRYFLKSGSAPNRGQVRGNRGETTRSAGVRPGSEFVPFSKLRIDFEQSGDRLIVSDGVVKGPIVGATFKGNLDNASRGLDFIGTFVPAYGLNNAFSQIPVIGRILGGGQDEGLFGITFRVGGTTAKPDLDVNAMSAIAPGIFRKVFEYEPPT